MRSNSVTAAIRFSPVLCYTPKSCLVVEIKGARPHALDPRGARAEGADGHGDGAGNVTLHRSDSLHSTSHVAEPAEGSVRPHPLSPGSSSTTAYHSNRKSDTASSCVIKRNLTRLEEPRNSGGTPPPHRQEEPHRGTGEEYHDTRDLTKEELESEKP